MLLIDTIYQGDCSDLMKDIEDNSIDLILTDPPYGHNNNNGDLIHRWELILGNKSLKPARPILNDGFNEANLHYEILINQAKRILKNGGVCCCCCCCGGPDPMFARWSLIMDKIINFNQMVVWDKGKIGMGWRYRRSYEVILVGYKGQKMNWYDESNKIENIIRHIGKIIPTKDNHPTEKPVKLMEHFKDGTLSEPVTKGTGFYIKSEGINSRADVYIFEGWSPLQISEIYDCHPDTDEERLGYYYDIINDIWIDDFSDYIIEWLEDDYEAYLNNN